MIGRVLFRIAKGLKYSHTYHKETILHKDFKCDNVVLDEISGNFNPIIIDFGKVCFETDAKVYTLSTLEKDKYKRYHPHVAPDVRDGLSKQSTRSDTYSFGRVLFISKKLTPALKSLADLCLQCNANDCPTAVDICTILQNLC